MVVLSCRLIGGGRFSVEAMAWAGLVVVVVVVVFLPCRSVGNQATHIHHTLSSFSSSSLLAVVGLLFLFVFE